MTGARDGRPLDALAARFGVARAFHGVDGARHRVPDETLVAVLAAMGVEAQTDARAAAALGELIAQAHARLLPPTIRLEQGAIPRLPVAAAALPAGAGWAIRCQGGDEREGAIDHDGGGPVLAGCADLPIGCHRLAVEWRRRRAETVLIVAPPAAWQIADAVETDGGERPRLWGLTAPLYGLRATAKRDRGIGTYAEWGDLAAAAAGLGASFVGANPVHALFAADPDRCSPYSPSSRLFHNLLHIAPDRAPGFSACPAAQDLWAADAGAIARLRNSTLVDYAAVAARLYPVLEALFASDPGLNGCGPASPDSEPAGEAALARHALFDALHEHFIRLQGPPAPWTDWPAPFRRPDSGAVADFASDNRDRIAFFIWLQRLADRQLADAARSARRAGMPLGLYADLAVGVARDGADTWANPGDFAAGMALGAPPDAFAPQGQNWALAPLNPAAVCAAAYRPVSAMLEATMRHAGLVRIDHVLGFARAFWIPDGLPGTYVRQPLDELLDIVAITSRMARCAVIGEDLGNVPDGLREKLDRRGILGTRLAWFERSAAGGFRPPEDYPQGVCAALSSHDLPTLRGFWKGTDIAWQRRLGRIDEDGQHRAAAARRADKAALADFAGCSAQSADDGLPGGFAAAVHGRLAAAPSALFSVQIEDMLGCGEQANVPGTVDRHPNWRRRLPIAAADLAGHAGAADVASAIRSVRRHVAGRPAAATDEPQTARTS